MEDKEIQEKFLINSELFSGGEKRKADLMADSVLTDYFHFFTATFWSPGTYMVILKCYLKLLIRDGFFFFLTMPCGLQDLNSLTRDWTPSHGGDLFTSFTSYDDTQIRHSSSGLYCIFIWSEGNNKLKWFAKWQKVRSRARINHVCCFLQEANTRVIHLTFFVQLHS